MTVKTVTGAEDFVLQESITAYADEAYTNARKLSSTGIVGSNPDIDPNTETFKGQIRWRKPMTYNVNVASLTDSTNGTTSSTGSEFLTYIKTVRSSGARKVNVQDLITKQDGLAKFGADLAEGRAQDEHDALLSVLKGVALSELMYGAHTASGSAGLGGQTFENDPTDRKYGFYIDLGANKLVNAASASSQGASRAEGFLQALGMAWKDYEPEYAYLVTSPAVMASLRSANLVDADRVTDGNINFNTLFQGKLRLLQTRAKQSFTPAELTKINTGSGIDLVGTTTSFIVLPGAIAMEQLAIETPTEILRNAAAYQGGGTTEVWHRWGYVAAPAGYDWQGKDDEFVKNEGYMGVLENGLMASQKALTAATLGANTRGVWARKFTSALSLGILPVFHG